MSLTEYDEEEAKKVFHDDGYNEGVEAGIAQQKAEDEKIIQGKELELQQRDAALQQKMSELQQRDAEITKMAEEMNRLKAMLEAK